MRCVRLRLMQAISLSLSALFFSLQASAQTKSVPARINQAVDDGNFVTLEGNTHPLARPEYDRGIAPDGLPMRRVLLVLQRAPEQERELRKLLEQQQIKSSPAYHQWLTPDQFGKQFGPAGADLQAVTDWLTTQGFAVNRVSAGRTVIEFSGAAGLVRQAFHTEIHKFTANGEEHWANAGDPQIPAALKPVVAGFVSLNNFPRKPLVHRLGTFSRSKLTGELKPLFTIVGPSQTFHLLGPTDFATIYNVLPLWSAGTDGTGQTIAIIGTSNINLQDVRDFRSMFGLPARDPQIIVDGPDPGIADPASEGEADLDVEWSGAVARNATIDLVVSQGTESTAGVDLSALYIVDNNLAPVVSASYGACEAEMGVGGNAFYTNLWQQAAAQGITALVASGDSGSATCDAFNGQTSAQHGLTVTGVASSPFNVAVGGTDFDDVGALAAPYWSTTNNSPSQSSALSYIPEITWNDSCAQSGLNGCTTATSSGANLIGGGGGPSNCVASTGVFPNITCSGGHAKPAWQTGTGVPSDGVRDLPDVSLFASNFHNGSGYILCQSDANGGSNQSSCDLNPPFTDFEGAGGTSFSAPAFAGIMAMVNQKTGQRQGNANYVLYPLAAQTGASCASNPAAVTATTCIFYDVVKGNNSVACTGGTPNCSTTAASSFGVLVDPSSLTSPAWTTSPGYDLATGLGTVNATNLVNQWNSVSFTPTTTTLALSTTPATSPVTITHGQPINFNVNVNSASGTPTGSAALLGPIGGPNNTPLGMGSFLLAGGAFTGQTVFLPGGTYSVTAHYAGDGTFGASDSTPPIQVTVNKESSQTQVGVVTMDLNTGQVTSTNASTFTYGSPYVVRANVLNSAGNACAPQATPGAPQSIPVSGCPTGTVTITANGSPLPNQNAPSAANYPLNSQGYTEDAPVQFPVASYNLLANYPGDGSYNSSTSATVAVSVTQAATSIDLNVQPQPLTLGDQADLHSYVYTHSNGGPLTGTVRFYSGSTQLPGTVQFIQQQLSGFAAAQATLTTPEIRGTGTLTAQYINDPNYAPSTSPPVNVIVVYPVTLTLTPDVVNVAPGTNVTITLIVDGQHSPAPTGTVDFTGLQVPITNPISYQTVTGPSGFPALQATVIYRADSSNVVLVHYSGDSIYASSPGTPAATINVPIPDFSLTGNSAGIAIPAPGQSGSYSITVSAINGFTGTVTFTCAISITMAEATCALIPASLSASGTSTLTVTTTASHTVGSSLYAPGNWFGGGRGIILVCALLLALALIGSKRRLAYGLLFFVLVAEGYSACGGGGGGVGGGPTTDPGTAAGAYTVMVTATSGALTHTSTVAVSLL